ncbi:hypothetical protein Tco_1092061 [Tanacetum coccineum]|uniref:Uncharacterized protein n=1 Tax=Tanacetum coccineum TaxID=301880 RepID=A0ABQ5I8U7_9ASTR
MEQMATLRELVDQAIQKKEEERDRSWKIPICYDDDEDNTIAITPVSPIEEPDTSLSMGDEHLDTIPATESDESDFYHEEFADELAHIISPPEYDHFCFKIEPELGNLTMDVDFPDCEDSRACSIHMSFTSSASFWESSIQI